MNLSKEFLLYEDNNIYVFFRPLGDVLIISFNEMGYSSSSSAWGGNLFLALGYSSLGFVSKRPNWFPAGSMKSALEVVVSVIEEYTKRITYGHSQGGYAAIKYSRPLGANAVLSFCPQYSISPEDLAQNDGRFVQYFTGHEHSPRITGGDIASSVHSYMFYDPVHTQDKFNAEKILEAVPALAAIKVFGTGHSSVRPFASKKAIMELFTLALNGDVSGIRRLSCDCKRSWGLRRTYLARSLARVKPSVAISVLDGHHHLLSKESAPELVEFLFRFAKYGYLSQYGLRIYHSVDEGGVMRIFLSMLAADNIRDALRLNAVHSIEYMQSPLVTDQFLPKIFFKEYDWVRFCEGWSSPEEWGVWGISLRSKIIIDWSKVPVSASSIKIKVSHHIPGAKITFKVSNDFQDAQQYNNIEGYVELNRALRISEVELHCSDLISPFVLGSGKDGRFLGIKLSHPREWF